MSGATVAASPALVARITVDDVAAGRPFDRRWLAPRGWTERAAAARLARGPAVGAARDLASRTPARLDATHASTWRGLLVAANGFDLDAPPGGEDLALGLRLANMGVRGTVARARAVALRLDGSDRRGAGGDATRETRAVLTRIRSRREVRAARGLAELRAAYIPAPASAAPVSQPIAPS